MKMFLVLALMISNVMAEEINVKVQGMVCSMCAQGIEKKFKAFKEIKELDVDLDQKFVKIKTHDGQTVNDEQIKNVIKEAGYNVSGIERK